MRSFLAKLATIDEQQLTSRELQIVEYIKKNLQTIVSSNMKIERLAQEVGTGYSAIYGLLYKLNIKGYRDFAILLANDADSAEIEIAKNDENVTNNYTNVIKQNYSLIEKKQLFETLKLIRSAQRIFVCHWEGVLSGPALELENFFYSLGMLVAQLDSDWDTINQRVDSMQKNDLFIFYTKYGTSQHLKIIIEKIHSKGGKIVFLSGRMPSATIVKNTDSIHTLLIDPFNTKNRELGISRSVPFHYFNDLLIYHYLYAKKSKK